MNNIENEEEFIKWWITQIAPLARVVKNSDGLPFKEVARAAWNASKKHSEKNNHE